MELVLASTSRYRRALLERLGVPFTCVAPGVDEAPFHATYHEPISLARALAVAKAEAVAALHPHAFVIGSDQVAEVRGHVLEKPGQVDAAMEQLRRLQGREHHLHTAVAYARPGHAVEVEVVSVRLHMIPLDDEAIRRYLAADEPFDCCGSYRIEARGIALFERIEASDFTAIEGLPMLTVARRLREAGFRLP